MTTGTQPDGRFIITGLAAGSYVLEYRGCAAHSRYLTRWSGGGTWQRTAARVMVRAYQVSHVPAMTLLPLDRAALLPDPASWRRMLANADRPLSAAAAARTGKITGVVKGEGKPLRGICVQALPASGNGFGYGVLSSKNGTYAISDVVPGRYYITFEQSGTCRDNANWLQQTYRGHNNPFGIGNVVKAVQGQTTRAIDAKLIHGGQISGVVSSRSGKRLRGICVQAGGALSGGFALYEVATGKDGSYVLHGLFPGRYFMSFSTGCPSSANYAPVSLAGFRLKGTNHRTVNVKLPVGAIISGTVRLGSSSGTALAGICVAATNSDGSIFAFTATGSSGRYSVNSLGNGEYQLSFAPGCTNTGNYTQVTKFAHATEGKVTRGVNATLQVGAVISGKVTNSSGQGLGGICIELAGTGTSANNPGSTNSDGSYVINEMAAGTYELGFTSGCGNNGNYAPYFYNNQSDPSLATPIQVASASTQTINARMRTGGEISGTVTDSKGRKLTGVCVGVAIPAFAELGGVFNQFTSTQGGQFDIAGLEPGQYYVDFGCGDPRHADQWFPDAPDSAAAHLISVSVGRTSGISAVLRPGGVISGVVTGTSGRPLANVCVQAFSAKNGAILGAAAIPALTNSRGAYSVPGLPAGRIDVEFSPCTVNSRYTTQWYRARAVQGTATPVNVRAGATTAHIDARLTIGGTISGRVVGASGEPLNNVCPFAFTNSGLLAAGQTGKTGTYTMLGVSTGKYTVEFEPCNGQNLVTVFKHASVTAPAATRNVDAKLVAGGSVSGVITTAGKTVTPVANECAELVRASTGSIAGISNSGLSGKYTATGLASGSYKVFFGNPAIGDPFCGFGPPDLAPQWYDNQTAQAKATVITVTAGQTTIGIDAALQTTGEITGTVSQPSGAALRGACVTAYPADGSSPLVAVSRSGGYSLIDLQPGWYRVEFSSGCGATGYRSQWWRNASSRRTAAVIKVTADQVVTGISAKLARERG